MGPGSIGTAPRAGFGELLVGQAHSSLTRSGEQHPHLAGDLEVLARGHDAHADALADAEEAQARAGPLADLAQRAQREAVSLVLCGERHAERHDAQPMPMWKRLARSWHATPLHARLEAL